MRCFFQIQDRWYVLANWQARLHAGDVAVFRDMEADDVAALLALRDEGYDDAAIFDRLYPTPPVTPAVSIPVDLLTKHQLAYLIEHALNCSLPSLKRLTKSDLTALLSCLD